MQLELVHVARKHLGQLERREQLAIAEINALETLPTRSQIRIDLVVVANHDLFAAATLDDRLEIVLRDRLGIDITDLPDRERLPLRSAAILDRRRLAHDLEREGAAIFV